MAAPFQQLHNFLEFVLVYCELPNFINSKMAFKYLNTKST